MPVDLWRGRPLDGREDGGTKKRDERFALASGGQLVCVLHRGEECCSGELYREQWNAGGGDGGRGGQNDTGQELQSMGRRRRG